MAPPTTPDRGSASNDLTGRLLAGRYRLTRPIASGGMATVWEGSDQLLARRVAVKVLHLHLATDFSFVQRFRQEAVAAARLAHPSIVSVYDTVEDQGLNAIVMELVSGTTLRADLDEHGPLQLHAVLAIGTQVADALGAAHDSGLVHRDVKPANILLSADGRVLVADFGIAKAAQGSDMTEAGTMVGTAKYLSPEQVNGGAIDGRSDLYSLGIVLYEALTGRPPFVADNDVGTALARLHRDPVPPRNYRTDIPEGVEQVVLRALSRKPGDRYPDAAAMRRALLAAGADPSRAQSVARAAVAAASGELPAASRSVTMNAPAPSPRSTIRPAEASRPVPPAQRPPLRPPGPRPPAPVQRPANPTPAPPPQVVRPTNPGYGHRPMGFTGYGDPSPLPAPKHLAPPRSKGVLWVVLSVGLVVTVGLGALLLMNRDQSTASRETVTLDIGSVSDFDPFDPDGTFEEQPQLLPNLIDDSPQSAWSTERYDSAQPAKGGVGIVAHFDTAHHIDTVILETAVGGWRANLYTVDEDTIPDGLDGWGEPIGSIDDAPTGTVEVHANGQSGKAVLIWFTRLAPVKNDKFAVQISDLTVRGT